MISDRFEDFAQALRVFIEQKLRFRELFLIDGPEAVGNLEHAIKGILDSFHSLYDAVGRTPGVEFDFYGQPCSAFMLHFRNAKHHNKANGVRSAYRFAQSNADVDPYLLVDFPANASEEGGCFVDHFVSWSDYCRYLTQLPDRHRGAAEGLIRAGVHADEFDQFAFSEGYSLAQVFINVIPIIIGAGTECIPTLAPHIHPESVEATYFLSHFQEVGIADFARAEYQELAAGLFRVPGP